MGQPPRNPTGKGGFVKGQSGNPGGKTRDRFEVYKAIDEAVNTRGGWLRMAGAIVDIATGDNPQAGPREQVAAFNAITNRRFGAPSVEVTTEATVTTTIPVEIPLDGVSDEGLARMQARLDEARAMAIAAREAEEASDPTLEH